VGRHSVVMEVQTVDACLRVQALPDSLQQRRHFLEDDRP
jgi:hypothetical protein